MRQDPRVRFCLSWIIPIWIIFEISLTKLPHYVLPTYPAIALLTAHMSLKKFPALKSKKYKWLAYSAWILAGIVLATTINVLPAYLNQKISLSGLAASLALIGIMVSFRASIKYKYLLIALGNALAMLLIFGITIPNLNQIWISKEITQIADRVKPCEHLSVASSGYNEPSLIFLAGTNTVTASSGDSIAQTLKENPCDIGVVAKDQVPNFLNSFGTNSPKPTEIAHIAGPNIGSGNKIDLTLYRLNKVSKDP